MTTDQREQNPDVNSNMPGTDPGEDPGAGYDRDQPSSDTEGGTGGTIPVPPDVEPAAPVEEPPKPEGEIPIGDVDDSPKKIV